MTGNATTPIPAFTGSFRENLEALVSVLERGDKDPAGKTIGFELERILIDRTGASVPFEGVRGVGALIAKLVELHPECEPVHIDGHLLGLSYRIDSGTESIEVAVSLEPAAQLEISAASPIPCARSTMPCAPSTPPWNAPAQKSASMPGWLPPVITQR